MYRILTIFLLTGFILSTFAQEQGTFTIARLKYNGGGDWYNDPSAEVNLLNFIRRNTNIKVDARYRFVEISSEEIFSYPLPSKFELY